MNAPPLEQGTIILSDGQDSERISKKLCGVILPFSGENSSFNGSSFFTILQNLIHSS